MKNFPDILIRMAQHSEAAAISALIYDSFVEERSQYTDGAFAFTTPGVAEVEERIKNQMVWVVIHEGVLVGTASCGRQGDGLLIKSVAVDRNARGKGIGKKLMQHMENLALENDYRFLKLTTAAFLLPACRMYEALGFRRNGFEMLHGTELIRMKKILNPFSSKIKLQKYDHAG